jgi:transcription initiation factor TFIIIB Brf1 subunit/transcription initiation factor TFIIB
MITSVTGSKCAECAGEILDLGDEMVCRTCGVVSGKEVVETRVGKALQAIDFTGQALGGYLGPPEPGFKERFSRGFSSSPSTFRYLKLISDYSGREDSTVYGCAKLIERVSEKLFLPRIVVGQAVTISKALFGPKSMRKELSSAAVSAYSIVTACKMLGVGSVSVREVVEAHRLLGRRVKMSSLIQLSIDSPFKTRPRRPEDYVNRIIARLESLPGASRSLRGGGLDPTTYFASLRMAAFEELASVREAERGGHSPCSLAATAVYSAESGLAARSFRRRLLTQRDIAESGGVAEYTVRELYGRLFRQPIRQALDVTNPVRTQSPLQ